MSVEVVISGQRVNKFVRPADIVANTLYTVAGQQATLIGLIIAPEATANVTVWWNDGVADRILINARTMASGNTETWSFCNLGLKNGQSLKVMTSVANTVSFTAVIAEEQSRPT